MGVSGKRIMGARGSAQADLQTAAPDDDASNSAKKKLGCCVVARSGVDVEGRALKAKMESAVVTTEDQCKKPPGTLLAVQLFAPVPDASTSSCDAVLSDIRLLSEVGQALKRNAQSFPISDSGWAEAEHLKNNPSEIGAHVVGSRASTTVVAACPVMKWKAPEYGTTPSDFLRWFACQSLESGSADKLARAMGMRKVTEEQLQLRLKDQLVSSVFGHLTWSMILTEQALREDPGSAMASESTLRSTLHLLQMWKDTISLDIDPAFGEVTMKLWKSLAEPQGSLAGFRVYSRWQALKAVQTSRLWNAAVLFTDVLKRQSDAGLVPSAPWMGHNPEPQPEGSAVSGTNMTLASLENPTVAYASYDSVALPLTDSWQNAQWQNEGTNFANHSGAVASVFSTEPSQSGGPNAQSNNFSNHAMVAESTSEEVTEEVEEPPPGLAVAGLAPEEARQVLPTLRNVAEMGRKVSREMQAESSASHEATGGMLVAAELEGVQKDLSEKGVLDWLWSQDSDDISSQSSGGLTKSPESAGGVATSPESPGNLTTLEDGDQSIADWAKKAGIERKDMDGKVIHANKYAKCNVLMAGWKGVLSSKEHSVPEEWVFPEGTQEHMYPKHIKYTPEDGGAKGDVLFIWPESDHNGAFAMNDHLCEWLACWAGKGYGVLAKSVGSVSQAIETLKGFGARSLAHVVLGGHGAQNSLSFGPSDQPDNQMLMTPEFLYGEDLELATGPGHLMAKARSTKTLLEELNTKLSAGASVMLEACSTAKGSGERMEAWEKAGARGQDPLNAEALKREGHHNLFEQVKINLGERTVYAPTRPFSTGDYYKSMGSDCSPDTPEGKTGYASSHTFRNGGRIVRALVELGNTESSR